MEIVLSSVIVRGMGNRIPGLLTIYFTNVWILIDAYYCSYSSVR